MNTLFRLPFHVSLDPAHWRNLLHEGRNEELCNIIIQVIRALGAHPIPTVDSATQQQIEALVPLILSTIADPSFRIPDSLTDYFILLNQRLSSLVALSSFKNTDAALRMLSSQSSNFVRLLALYSARNTVTFDRAAIFQTNAFLASTWYIQFAQIFHGGLTSRTVIDNLQAHYKFPAVSFIPTVNMPEAYFGSTYVDGRCDRLIKPHINQSIRNHYGKIPPNTTRPNPRKIAVISTCWDKRHSVHRNYASLLTALKPKYHLTFFQIGDYSRQDTELFDEVRILETTHGFPDVTPLLQGDFQLLIYPDIGMANESIILANLRLAPIQIALLGHSVSTWGADIDYFISGAEVEVADHPEQHYSERLVLLPGMGCCHNVPDYPSRRKSPLPAISPHDRITINFPCNSHKFNSDFVATLARLCAACTRPVLFRVFVGKHPLLASDLHPFRRDLEAAVGTDSVDVVANLPYEQYMAAMEPGQISFDTFHFGGCNTVSDSLFLGIPMLCWEGDKWYNRIGPAMLRRAGLSELIATTEQEYLSIAHKLIHDEPWRNALRERLLSANLKESLYSTDDAPHFLTAIDYLIGQHDMLKQATQRDAIRIACPPPPPRFK